MRAPRRVLLVGMPFANVDLPSLSIALLQGHLQRAGFVCDARYALLELAGRIDPAVLAFASGGPMAGEWLFVPALYGEPVVADDVEAYARYAHRALGNPIDDAMLDRMVAARGECTALVDELADTTDWSAYDAVGFSVVFQQTLASLALAKRIKARRPDLPVLFGGASMHGEMGVAIHERFPQVDLVCTGEADDIVVELFTAAIDGAPLDHLPGIVRRAGDSTVVHPPAPPVTQLDALPHPVFDDWFAQRAAAGLDDGTRAVMVETSRGCWWGAISHCTFCGLNGATMAYRSKSPDRAFDEIVALRDRYRASFVTVADNILDLRYLRTVVPRLAELDPPLELYVEVRPKLRQHQVGQLALAGVRSIQPGIESFSDRSLELMGKATTGLEGIQLLKWCAEYGLGVEWSYLYGFPGETPDDHRRGARLARAARHLPPPNLVTRAQIHRFSPLHERAAELGFVDVTAEAVYQLLFPFDQEVLDRIAYVFDAEFAPGLEVALEADDLIETVRSWIADAGTGGLWVLDHDDGSLQLIDRRPWAAQQPAARLTGWRAELYRRCDQVVERAELRRIAASLGVDEEAADRFLAWGIERSLLVDDDDRIVALAVHHPPRPVRPVRRTHATLAVVGR